VTVRSRKAVAAYDRAVPFEDREDILQSALDQIRGASERQAVEAHETAERISERQLEQQQLAAQQAALVAEFVAAMNAHGNPGATRLPARARMSRRRWWRGPRRRRGWRVQVVYRSHERSSIENRRSECVSVDGRIWWSGYPDEPGEWLDPEEYLLRNGLDRVWPDDLSAVLAEHGIIQL
jgi:hypothetical protein